MSYKAIKEAYHQMLIESTEHPMIEVDGVMKHRHNSLGQPIHHTEEGIKNFHRWFGDSTTVDEHGRPIVLYHGTGESFESFNTVGGTGKTSDTGAFFTDNPHVASTYAHGETRQVFPVYVKIHSPVIVDANGKNWDSIQQKAKVQLPTKTGKTKPSTIRTMFKGSWYDADDTASTDDIARWARKNGHSGVIIKNVKDRGPVDSGHYISTARNPATLIVAFHPHQIKSAIGNSGAFSHPTKITESAYDSIATSYIQMIQTKE